MIYLQKSSEIPPILLESQKQLNDLIKNYGSIVAIPEEKKKFLNNYKQKDVQNVLFNSSLDKCAYCETRPIGGFLEVDHFKPKMKYPKFWFEWSNLIPSCKRCNLSKSAHDTISMPIINPYDINPERYFKYGYLRIEVSSTSPDIEIAKRTIDVCDLNRISLVKERSTILIELEIFLRHLEEALNKFKDSDTELKELRRLNKLRDALEIIEGTTKKEEKYSGLSTYFLNNSNSYQKVKYIIEERNNFKNL